MGPGHQFFGDQNQVVPARYDRNAMTTAGFVGPNKASRCPGTELFEQQTAQCATLTQMRAWRAVRQLKCGTGRRRHERESGGRQRVREKPWSAQQVADLSQD